MKKTMEFAVVYQVEGLTKHQYGLSIGDAYKTADNLHGTVKRIVLNHDGSKGLEDFYKIDFIVDGVGYSQDSDCYTWKWNLQTLRKSRISDNTYCAAFAQYKVAKEGKRIMTYKDFAIFQLVDEIIRSTGWDKDKAEKLLYNALTYNVVRAEIFGQVMFLNNEYKGELMAPDDTVSVDLNKLRECDSETAAEEVEQ